MKNILIFLIFALLSFDCFAKPRAEANRTSEKQATNQDVLLIAGIQSTLDINFEPCSVTEECIRVANKALTTVQFSKDKKQLIFTPVKKGETTITVRDDDGDIRLILRAVVSDSNLERRAAELRKLLQDIEGIDIKIMSDKIVVDGEVVVIRDLNRVYAVLSDEAYKGLVLNLVEVSPMGMQLLAQRIQEEINNPNIKVRVLNGLFLVEGTVDTIQQANSAIEIARNMVQGFALPTYAYDGKNPLDVKRAVVKDPIIHRIAIAAPKPPPLPKMVRVTVDFVELSKDYLRNFGFSWVPSLDTGGTLSFGPSTTGGVTSQASGSISGTIGNLFPKLNSAQNAGYARILEESILIVKDGRQAVFNKQLQIPVQVLNDKGNPDFKVVKAGPNIIVAPRIQGRGEDIDLNIDFTYSGIAGKTSTAPITLDHTYKGNLIVRSGESAAIVNAISNNISTAFNKDPPGSGIPANPLFTLLRSKAFQKNKSQFVVFITPQIIESSSTGTEDIKNKYGMKRK